MGLFSKRIHFASAPVSWGVQDDPGPAWEQPYECILDEILSAGYTGTELGPYGYFPTDPKVLGESLKRRQMSMLSSSVPVPITHSRRPALGLGCQAARALRCTNAETATARRA